MNKRVFAMTMSHGETAKSFTLLRFEFDPRHDGVGVKGAFAEFI